MESLHNHTIFSDGVLTHRGLFDAFEKKGGSVIAFTDHDALPNDKALATLDSLRDRKLKWIIGIEITTLVPLDLGTRGVLHLIGLFVDPKNPGLIEHGVMAQEARVRRMRGMVENLRQIGFRISERDCEEEAEGESVGRPHIVRALARHPENAAVMSGLVEEMRKDSEHDPVVRTKYTRMKASGEGQYPYSLFLSPDAYRPAYVEMTYIPDFDRAVRLVREAGGISSIAHYKTVHEKLSLSSVEKLLVTGRVDAMETVYGMHAYGTSLEGEMVDERRALRDVVRKTGAIETGGGDIHTPEDLELYCDIPDFFEEMNGCTDRILKSKKADQRWSSLV
jgi:predicted metal-dependent phosphoesterase TrpH